MKCRYVYTELHGFYILLTVHLVTNFASNQLDALFHVFIYFISLQCFEHHSAHNQEIELY